MRAPLSVRWLALAFPSLALDLYGSKANVDESAELGDGKTPFVLLHGPSTRRLVYQACSYAQQLGIRPGHSHTQAQALLDPAIPLRSCMRDREAELAGLRQLAAWAYQYSDQVVVESAQDRILLELGRSRALFGSSLLTRLRAELNELGFSPCFGSGPTPAKARVSAYVAAQSGRDTVFERLERVPLSACELVPKAQQILMDCGIHNLHQALALPRTELAQRIGPAAVLRLYALGNNATDEALKYFVPEPKFDVSLELPAPSHQHEVLMFALNRLLGLLAAALRSADLGVQSMQLTLTLCSPAQPCTLDLRLGEAQREREHWRQLWRMRLEQFTLPADVLGLRLQAGQWLPMTVQTSDLWQKSNHNGSDWQRLLDRLRVRLGQASLYRIQQHPDYRPEYYRRVWLAEQTEKPTHCPTLAQHRNHPFWLYPSPQAINRADFELQSSAERIEGGWWDDHDVRRDYYRARKRDGLYYWIFQDLRTQIWYCQGLFS